MAAFTGTDLRKWRESQRISAADLAERISCDTTTIYRYESGKMKPNPDVMWEICDALGDTGIWVNWMRTEYPASFGREFPEMPIYDLKAALLQVFAELEDVLELRKDAMKDGSDGKIDNPELKKSMEIELTEAIQAAQRAVNLLKGQKQ